MIKKILFSTILGIFVLPLPVRAELTTEAIESIGRFLVMDFLTAKSSKNSKPLTNIFYVKETDDIREITEKGIDYIELHGDLTPGEYKRIKIINEVSGLGALLRNAYINKDNQIFWGDISYSLKYFFWKKTFGYSDAGVRALMEISDADIISGLFQGCQRGEIQIEWEPSGAELDFYLRTINIFYEIGAHNW